MAASSLCPSSSTSAILLAGYPAILLSAYPAIMLSCSPAILLSCNPAIQLSCYHVILLSCYPTILLSCYPAILLSSDCLLCRLQDGSSITVPQFSNICSAVCHNISSTSLQLCPQKVVHILIFMCAFYVLV